MVQKEMTRSQLSRRSSLLMAAMFIIPFLVTPFRCLLAQDAPFSGAQWIALEADSTILFPHIHLLKAKSDEGQSLKEYALPVLSKELCLYDKEVLRARASVCGLGHYELFIDGQRAGRHFLDPGWTMYDHALLYNVHDVTSLLAGATRHTVSVMLGGGMYDIPVKGYHKFAGSCGAPKLLFALHIDYADGTRQTLLSDDSWMACESNVRYSSIFAGEHYDATFEGHQRPVRLTSPHWQASLTEQTAGTRLYIKKELPMRRLPGTRIYDSGQNCSGIVRITVRGKRGATITLRPAEILKDGTVFQRCAPNYKWSYTLSGDSAGETWQPQFTYTGFRYVEAEGEGVELLSMTALHTSADIATTGTFECSDTLLNSIFTLIDWAISSNLTSITTDCPTREKLGWQEQNHLMAFSMMYRYDMHDLMNKIADDLAHSQHADGAIPTIAPEYTRFAAGSGFEDTPEWGASFILCPYYTYQWYGDDSAMRTHYSAMKRYMDYLGRRAEGGILNYGLGDWFDIGPDRPGVAQLTSVALSATAMYHYELCVMARVASLLGFDLDARHFIQEAGKVKTAFNTRFWDPQHLRYENGSQTASAMALAMNLVTDENRRHVLQGLADDITTRLDTVAAGGALVTAGDVGYRYVLLALLDGRLSDIVWQLTQRDDCPGYAWQLRQGATALTESWQAYDNVSNNHLMLGHLMEWMFAGPGGIRQKEGSAAWRHIVIDPQMVGTLEWAKATITVTTGIVSCQWEASADRRRWTVSVTVPEGSDAEVHLPGGKTVNVEEGHHTFSSEQL